jgi:DNA mismatch repair protein MutS
MALVEEYFKFYEKYATKYENFVILMQKGDFYELYSYEETINQFKKIADLLNIQLTRSNKKLEISKSNPYMMGIPIHVLHKYIRILIDNYYVVIQIEQEKTDTKILRKVTNIYTNSNYIEGSQKPDNNNIVSIYFEKEKKYTYIGLSAIDLTTGNSNVYQIVNIDEKFCLDEALKYIQVYYPNEVIFISDIHPDEKERIFRILELSDKRYTYNKFNKVNSKISYQNEFFKKLFPKAGCLSPIENLDLENYEYARNSYISLLDYIYQSRPNILVNLKVPKINDIFNTQKFMTLGNDSITQLNLVQANGYNNSSMFDILNMTKTFMGARFLKYNLLNPLINEDILNQRYNSIEEINKNNLSEKIDNLLSGMCDLERYNRKLETGMLNPFDFQSMAKTYDLVIDLYNLISKFPYINNYKLSDIKELNELIGFYQSKFDLSLMTCNINDTIETSFIKKNVNREIDNIMDEMNICSNFMTELSKELCKYLDNKKDLFDDTCVIRVISTEKEYYLETTKKRAETIQKTMKEIKIGKYTIKPEEIQFDISSRSTIARIRTKYLSDNSDRLIELTELLNKKIKEEYKKILFDIFQDYSILQNEVIDMIANIDYINSGAKVAIKYKYCKPIIKDNSKSFIVTKKMRHPIIERINTKVNYIPHDISLSDPNGNTHDGILLYGLNSAGKTTIVRSLGLSIVIAQMGYYVPCDSMIYKPYHNLYTRISGSDNLYKNLSSFGVEMAELDIIMRRSGKNSLVLSDELCRGTETDSAMIIVLGMIEKLVKTNTNFISATHLHELSQMNRIKSKKNIGIFHIHIEYDEINHKLIYTRELREGSGLNFYGLLVAKCMIRDEDFIKYTDEIRKELNNDTSIISKKKSNYNSNIFMTQCQICKHIPKKGEIPLETHHINEQYKSINNMINGIHKNDNRNLVVLCSRCHDMTERYIDGMKIKINGYIDTNNGPELNFEFII